MVDTSVEAALSSALADAQYGRIADLLDAAELESNDPDVLVNWPHILHLLGLIYDRRLEDARLLWKRLPPEVKQDNAELDATWRLLQYCWGRQHAGVWAALQGFQWSPPVRPFIDALAARCRADMLALLGEGYSLVSGAKAAALLGVPESELPSLVEAAGFHTDMESGMYVPAPPVVEDPDLNGYENLRSLAAYMVQLES